MRPATEEMFTRVAAAVAELVEEDLGRGRRPEEIDLDHLPPVGALLAGEGAEQHHAGVVDENVGAAELAGHRPDAVWAAREERDAVAVGGQCASGSLADVRGCPGDDGDATSSVLVGQGDIKHRTGTNRLRHPVPGKLTPGAVARTVRRPALP